MQQPLKRSRCVWIPLLYMYVYVHVHVYVYASASASASLHVFVSVYVYVYVFAVAWLLSIGKRSVGQVVRADHLSQLGAEHVRTDQEEYVRVDILVVYV